MVTTMQSPILSNELARTRQKAIREYRQHEYLATPSQTEGLRAVLARLFSRRLASPADRGTQTASRRASQPSSFDIAGRGAD